MFGRAFMFGKSQRRVVLTGDNFDYNLATALGNPGGTLNITVIVDFGATVQSTSFITPAFQTGSFSPGTQITLINNGAIYGRGGTGGSGGRVTSGTTCANGGGAGAGGNAISLAHNISIDNSVGNIFGGGGGGGGGGGSANWNPSLFGPITQWGGGGGGGGAGSGTGGALQSPFSGGSPVYSGTVGTAGSLVGNGAGGAGGSGVDGDGNTFHAGNGGNGGGFGAAGVAGTAGNVSAGSPLCNGSGSAGGAAGKAVNLNGFAVTWIAGNNPTQVKGAVS